MLTPEATVDGGLPGGQESQDLGIVKIGIRGLVRGDEPPRVSVFHEHIEQLPKGCWSGSDGGVGDAIQGEGLEKGVCHDHPVLPVDELLPKSVVDETEDRFVNGHRLNPLKPSGYFS